MAPKAMPRTFTKMSSEEIRLAQMWFEHDAKKPAEIAELLHRNKSTITRHCVKLVVKKKQGRKPALSEAQKDQLVKKVEYMIKKAKGEWRVTADMVRKTLRLKVSTKCVLGALHSRGIYFRAMRQKPLLTEQDIMDRHQFAKTYARKTRQWWLQHIQLTIDVKYFRVYLDKEARSRAAKEGTWGAFRQKGQGLDAPYVRPSKRLKWNPGARGVHVLAGVGNGRVLVWRYLDSKKKVMWSGRTAAECYRGPIQKALRSTIPCAPAGTSSKITIRPDFVPEQDLPPRRTLESRRSRSRSAPLSSTSATTPSGPRLSGVCVARSRSSRPARGSLGRTSWNAYVGQLCGSRRASSTRASWACACGANGSWPRRVGTLRRARSRVC